MILQLNKFRVRGGLIVKRANMVEAHPGISAYTKETELRILVNGSGTEISYVSLLGFSFNLLRRTRRSCLIAAGIKPVLFPTRLLESNLKLTPP
jgi:hypothetical protein